jgi:hypothetical protein
VSVESSRSARSSRRDEQAEALLRQLDVSPADTPLVLGGSLVLRNPSNADLARALHLGQSLRRRELRASHLAAR